MNSYYCSDLKLSDKNSMSENVFSKFINPQEDQTYLKSMFPKINLFLLITDFQVLDAV